ncbi:MAG: hypothetical protein HOH43_20530 [Candidatus Latescibacteria bacterium]|nr:hypothetical protein [Candidatus Latescibacterota bacterium]
MRICVGFQDQPVKLGIPPFLDGATGVTNRVFKGDALGLRQLAVDAVVENYIDSIVRPFTRCKVD